MRYVYTCLDCNKETVVEVMLSSVPQSWSPPVYEDCRHCGSRASREYGCEIGIQDDSDETKHIGKSTSSSSNFQFIGDGFPDVDRRLIAEQDEIDRLMEEPLTREEIQAGNQQMEELEKELGKPKGSISGEREMEEVEIVGASDDEINRSNAGENQSLGSEGLSDDEGSGLSKAQGDSNDTSSEPKRRVLISADDAHAAKEYQLPPLQKGERVVKKIAKRRGKEVLAEEAKNNKAMRH